jgi:hypothetical protein
VLKYKKLSSAKVTDSGGKKIKFEIIDGDTIKFKTKKGEFYTITELSTDIKFSIPEEFLGAVIDNIYSEEIAKSLSLKTDNGAFISDISDSAVAYRLGFEKNDVICTVNGQTTNNVVAVNKIYNDLPFENTVTVTVKRGEKFYDIKFNKSEYLNYITVPGKIEAEDFDEKKGGVTVEGCGEGGQNLGFINGGDYVVYKDVYVNGVIDRATLRAAAWDNAKITLRLDDPKGTVIAEFRPSQTGEYQVYKTNEAVVTEEIPIGIHDIYLVLNPGVNINWFSLEGVDRFVKNISETTAPDGFK